MARAEQAFTVPAREGVSASCVSLPAGTWLGLLDFLAQRFPRISRVEWANRMARGDVLNDLGQPLEPAQAYTPHRKVFYFRQPPPELLIPFDEIVLYQDEHLVVADKPHFLPVTPSGRYLQQTLLVRLKRRLRLSALVPLHRIDRDTAGLVLFSVNPASRGAYAALFREREIAKHYQAIAPWCGDMLLPQVYRSRLESGEAGGASFMQMTQMPGVPNAETRIELVAVQGALALYNLFPVTGYRHQLRVHMAALGVPIVNDGIYPVLTPELPQGTAPDYRHPLQLLAKTLTFTDPISGVTRRFESQRTLSMALPIELPIELPVTLSAAEESRGRSSAGL